MALSWGCSLIRSTGLYLVGFICFLLIVRSEGIAANEFTDSSSGGETSFRSAEVDFDRKDDMSAVKTIPLLKKRNQMSMRHLPSSTGEARRCVSSGLPADRSGVAMRIGCGRR